MAVHVGMNGTQQFASRARRTALVIFVNVRTLALATYTLSRLQSIAAKVNPTTRTLTLPHCLAPPRRPHSRHPLGLSSLYADTTLAACGPTTSNESRRGNHRSRAHLRVLRLPFPVKTSEIAHGPIVPRSSGLFTLMSTVLLGVGKARQQPIVTLMLPFHRSNTRYRYINPAEIEWLLGFRRFVSKTRADENASVGM